MTLNMAVTGTKNYCVFFVSTFYYDYLSALETEHNKCGEMGGFK